MRTRPVALILALAAGAVLAQGGDDDQSNKLTAPDVVKVYAGQGADTEVKIRLVKGLEVKVVDDPGGDWIKIDYGAGKGWVYRPSFEATGATAPPEEKPEAAQKAESPRRLVATAVVNVRAGQSTDTEIIGRIENGATVAVVDNPGGDWIKVDYGAGKGWVYRPLFETPEE